MNSTLNKNEQRRRQLLQGIGSVSAVASLSSLTPLTSAFANSSVTGERQKLLIMVYMKGGNDPYNTFVPLNNANYKSLRPNLAIDRGQTIAFTETHGIRKELAPIMPMFERKQIAVLQGIGFHGVTHQHYNDAEIAFTGGEPGQFLNEGWISRAFKGRKFASPVDAIALDDLDLRVEDGFGPFRGNTIRAINLLHPSVYVAKGNVAGSKHELNEPAKAHAAKDKTVLSQLNLPAHTLKTAFPRDHFGQGVSAAVQLAASQPNLPVIHLTINSEDGDHHNAFDTHWDQLKYHGPTLTRLANGLAALEAGLKEIGRWNDTLVMTYDEFGRSPVENERMGTHHGNASIQLLMGGRVKGGLYGEPLAVQKFGNQIGGPPPVIDYRELYTTVIDKWWGFDQGQGAANVFSKRFKSLDVIA